MTAFHHVTVLREETVELLAVREGGTYVDCTLGGGGHAATILERSAPGGHVVGFDRDEIALEAARARLAPFGPRVTFVHAPFSQLRSELSARSLGPVDGILADLGVSSPQLDEPSRGFSFSQEGPLDMRMDASAGERALDLVARLDERELADVLYHYGEERKSRPVARSIKRAEMDGRLETTLDLARAVRAVLGPRRGGIDPCTRTFQAIRIAVNDELGELRTLLADAPDALAIGGRVAVISFHSLEDRLVKHAFRDDARLEPLTKKPVIADEASCGENPRARSAKLRCARRVEVSA